MSYALLKLVVSRLSRSSFSSFSFFRSVTYGHSRSCAATGSDIIIIIVDDPLNELGYHISSTPVSAFHFICSRNFFPSSPPLRENILILGVTEFWLRNSRLSRHLLSRKTTHCYLLLHTYQHLRFIHKMCDYHHHFTITGLDVFYYVSHEICFYSRICFFSWKLPIIFHH